VVNIGSLWIIGLLIIGVSIAIAFPLVFLRLLKYILKGRNERRRKSSNQGKWTKAQPYWARWAYITSIGCISFYSIVIIFAYLDHIPNGIDIILGIGFALIFSLLFFFIFHKLKRSKGKLMKYFNLPNFMIDRDDYNKQRPHPTKLKKAIESCVNDEMEYKVDESKYGEDRIFGWNFNFPNNDFHLDIEKVMMHYNDEFEFLIGPISIDNKDKVYKLMRKLDAKLTKKSIK